MSTSVQRWVWMHHYDPAPDPSHPLLLLRNYYQVLCSKGHYYTDDASCYAQPGSCPDCGELPTWVHLVDDTNGCMPQEDGTCYCGALDMKKFLVTPRSKHSCSFCLGVHWRSSTYRMPDDLTAHVYKEIVDANP